MNNETINFTCTYTPEDNKLRIRHDAERVSPELYERLRDNGFKWAPMQELFVAPAWTPAREDLCMELAGSIEPEQITLAERAEIKAARLDALAESKQEQSFAFAEAANKLSVLLSTGQPVLVSHHSERKAVKQEKQLERLREKADSASDAIRYYQWKAEGVERHVNRKQDAGVRFRRMKTLLADMRGYQRDLNEANLYLSLWQKVVTDVSGSKAVSSYDAVYRIYNHGGYRFMTKGAIQQLDVIRDREDRNECLHELYENIVAPTIARLETLANSQFKLRFINHLLNRLAWERSELGDIARFDGALTAPIIQTFLRTQGADSPKATKSDKGWIAKSVCPFPHHIGEGREIELSDAEWKNLFFTAGYEVPVSKAPANPLLNLDVAAIKSNNQYHRGEVDSFDVIHMSKAEYSALHSDDKGVRKSLCNGFRFKVARKPGAGAYFSRPFVAVFLTDSKVHPTPDSNAIVLKVA